MQVNVAQLLKEPVGSTRSYDISELQDKEERAASNLKGKVKLLRTDREILVRARLKNWVEAICSRCLASSRVPLELNIEEEYFPSIEVNTGLSLPLPQEPGAFLIDQNHILDLGEAVRQYTLMAMPMKPLCSPRCAGLCPQCGHNLNEGLCGCSPVVDPRWEELRKIAAERLTKSGERS